jgi:hypothetical protein
MSSTEHLIQHLPNDIGGQEADAINMTEHEMLPWEKRCHALLDVLATHKIVNTEEKRRGIENLGSEIIGKLSYYERWIVSAVNILYEKRILTPDQIAEKTDEISKRKL